MLDNIGSSNLCNIGFIWSKDNFEMSIEGTYLYVNSLTDMVIVELAKWRQPQRSVAPAECISSGSVRL
jgi:hypothetical protein